MDLTKSGKMNLCRFECMNKYFFIVNLEVKVIEFGNEFCES